MNIYFFQCQEDYNNSIYLPYTSGVLWSYVNQFDDIQVNYNLIDIFFEKKDPLEYIDTLGKIKPDLVLFSNYGWNTRYHMDLAKRIKERFPDVKIIIGGPNSQIDEDYLEEHFYVDIGTWGEGEGTLLDLLRYYIGQIDNLESIPGIAYIENKKYYKTEKRKRKTELTIPSPYLTGLFDSYFEKYNYNFMPIWETNRGCPYHCTFCDLGADYYNKLYDFNLDKLLSEIDWFVDKKIEYVEIADANFGILPRDIEIVKYIKQKHVETGYPKKINATWAKNSPDRVFDMSKILESINRGGVTLALQSLNKTALDNIKRFNIVNHRLEETIKKYQEYDIQTYHDFILGLPGETLDSWKEGLLYTIDINPNGWIFGHPLEAYKNTEFSDPQYITKHKLQFVQTPQVTFFSKRNKNIEIEFGNYVIETFSMTKEQYVEAFLFKWFLILVHSLGWAHYTASNCGEKRRFFYLKLYDWMRNNNCVLKNEYVITKNSLLNTINNGNFWGRQMFGEDDIYWEYESASCIILEQNRQIFYNDLKEFCKSYYPQLDDNTIDLNDNQVISFSRKYKSKPKYDSFQDFCIEIYWYGRRRKAWLVNE